MACTKIISKMDKEFCPNCGYPYLERTEVTVDNDGLMNLYIDFENLRVTRGFRHSVKAPKGGKHDIIEKQFENQRIPHNRMSKMKNVNFFIN